MERQRGVGNWLVAAAISCATCVGMPQGWADGTPASTESAAAAAAPSLPAGTRHWAMSGTTLVVVTARGSLAVFDARDPRNPQLRSERELEGEVIGLRLSEGVVFAVIARQQVEALAVTSDGKLAPWRPSAASPDAPAPPTATVAASAAPVGTAVQAGTPVAGGVLGRVTKVQRGTVLLALDPGQSVKPGDAVLVRSQVRERRMNLFTNREEEVVSNAPLAVLEVRQVEGTQALAELDRGDEAHAGDTIERTDRRPRGAPWYAPRTGYSGWVRSTLRPFPNFGELAVGSLTDLAGGWYWGALHLQARLAPWAVSAPHTTQAYNLQVIASYQSDMAEFGIGTGYFSHNFEGTDEYDCSNSGYASSVAVAKDEASNSEVKVYTCRQAGPSVVQHLRLGSIDGLNVRITNTLAVDSGRFRFGYLDGSLDIPLSRTLNVFASGGGSTGMRWGEAGVRTYLRGVGGRDTLILTTGLGGSSFRTTKQFGGQVQQYDVGGGQKLTQLVDAERAVGGLHLAIGLEWRY